MEIFMGSSSDKMSLEYCSLIEAKFRYVANGLTILY